MNSNNTIKNKDIMNINNEDGENIEMEIKSDVIKTKKQKINNKKTIKKDDIKKEDVKKDDEVMKYDEETPWSIINSYFENQHLQRLVRHQIES